MGSLEEIPISNEEQKAGRGGSLQDLEEKCRVLVTLLGGSLVTLCLPGSLLSLSTAAEHFPVNVCAHALEPQAHLPACLHSQLQAGT